MNTKHINYFRLEWFKVKFGCLHSLSCDGDGSDETDDEKINCFKTYFDIFMNIFRIGYVFQKLKVDS